MKVYKPFYTFTWWQVGIFKVSLLSLGALAGSYWPELFSGMAIPLIVIAVLSTAYIMYIGMRG
jgi:hypothetical protein